MQKYIMTIARNVEMQIFVVATVNLKGPALLNALNGVSIN